MQPTCSNHSKHSSVFSDKSDEREPDVLPNQFLPKSSLFIKAIEVIRTFFYWVNLLIACVRITWHKKGARHESK